MNAEQSWLWKEQAVQNFFDSSTKAFMAYSCMQKGFLNELLLNCPRHVCVR